MRVARRDHRRSGGGLARADERKLAPRAKPAMMSFAAAGGRHLLRTYRASAHSTIGRRRRDRIKENRNGNFLVVYRGVWIDALEPFATRSVDLGAS